MARPFLKPNGVGQFNSLQREEWCCATPAGEKADESFWVLELSRKLKKDSPDADLVEVVDKAAKALEDDSDLGMALEALPELIDQLEVEMKEAAKRLDFEEAANMRDRIKSLRKKW